MVNEPSVFELSRFDCIIIITIIIIIIIIIIEVQLPYISFLVKIKVGYCHAFLFW